MSVILEELHNKFDGKYDYLRVNKVDVNKETGKAEIVFIFPYEKEGEFTDKDRELVTRWIMYMMPNKLTYEVLFKKSYIDEEVLLRKVKEYFRCELRTIAHQLNEGDIRVKLDDKMKVYIDIGPRFYDFLVSQQKIEESLKYYLEHNFTKEATIIVTKKEKDNDFVFESHEDAMVEYHRREIDAVEKEMGNIIGKGIVTKPMYIVDIKNPMENITIAGKIEMFSRKISKAGHIYYTFVVNDTTSKIACKYFTRRTDKGILDSMQDGMEVLIEGNAEEDSYIKAMSVWVRRLSFAKINYDSISLETNKNILHKNYLTVQPEVYVDIKQQDIFSMAEEEKVPSYLLGKEFVVFDFETTGLNEKEDRPIELGAMRIKDGKKTLTFSTLIDPERDIPEEVQGITHIDNDMVKGKPTWREVVADFYKFTRGAALVGHNVMFDYHILENNSKDLGYTFDNELVDTLKLAMTYVRGQANNKLITLCNHFGISLEGAHRALNDVDATAELFMRIAKDYLSD